MSVLVVLLFCGKSAGWNLLTGPAATQNTGLHCSLYCIRLYCVAPLSVVVFYFNAFFCLL